ncbi:hypothetical protein [Actinopolyspora erythraea]|uniref:hypothetical protein n=1 Tax=Actinopolyspora erythraea TaxID=414996 RepID=UPI00178CD119|nr:hypothetical protein [Actinopolyspora erythraea]
MQDKDEPGAVVTLDDMYQQIKALRSDVDKLAFKIDCLSQEKQDHGRRIRNLEVKVWPAIGAVGLLAWIIPQIPELFNTLGG